MAFKGVTRTTVSTVSILIPAYNRDQLFGTCIQLALDQTVTDLEVVVVDSASTDGTWEVCQGFVGRNHLPTKESFTSISEDLYGISKLAVEVTDKINRKLKDPRKKNRVDPIFYFFMMN